MKRIIKIAEAIFFFTFTFLMIAPNTEAQTTGEFDINKVP